MDEIQIDDDNAVANSDEKAVTESVNIVEDDISIGDGVIEPKVGMQFKDLQEMFDFYKKYSYAVGFPVKKRNSKKGDDGELRYVTLTCSREGQRFGNTSGSLKPQPTIQMGCKARISASSDTYGGWRINKVRLEHNHETSPSKSRLYRCNRELSSHVKRRLEVNDLAGIPLHKSFNSAVVEAGGYENMSCIEKDCRNYIEEVRRLRLGEGDAAAIQSYFSTMQAQCEGFYFSMDLDDESQLKNVFWADNRCRQAYKEFGDVVTFDTTYLTNKYDMPFAPFVGVNHHGQSTLLGCGLLSNEDTNTFVWLFKTWLQCMHGHAPQGIITDQDRAMQNAIEIVFPNTRHRWCLWHILKKLPEKFGYHYDKSSIFHTIHELVYESQFVQEFEAGWAAMIERYGLQDNDWLSGLYDNRGRWVPCFLKTFFWAGMSTTQRSESMNAFFDGYVHSKTSLKQFVEQYERALRSKVEKEFQADFKSFSQMIPCATQYDMEQQFQSVYTLEKFREAQTEFTGKVYCDIMATMEANLVTTYEVREDVMYEWGQKRKAFFVSFDKENCHIVCSCHLFEFRGILCRHAIAVLIRCDVRALPERYILRRWRRDVRRAHMRVVVKYDGMVPSPEQVRYNEMCREFAEVADLAAADEGRSRVLKDWIKLQYKELTTLKRSCSGSNVISHQTLQLAETCAGSKNNTSVNIGDPKSSRRKGAPRKLRRKSGLESSSQKVRGKKPIARHIDMQERNVDNRGSQQQQISTQPPIAYLQYSVPFGYSYTNLPLSNLLPESNANVVYTSQGQPPLYHNPPLPDQGGPGN